LSTKIHAMVDALGNPLAFLLTAGQAHDLEGADAMLPQMQADALLADKAFDADLRVIEPLLAAGKTPVIPPKSNRAIERSNAPTTRNCTKRATSWKISIASSNSTEP
jgi:transposase